MIQSTITMQTDKQLSFMQSSTWVHTCPGGGDGGGPGIPIPVQHGWFGFIQAQ